LVFDDHTGRPKNRITLLPVVFQIPKEFTGLGIDALANGLELIRPHVA
jgi:hypothetical protein